MSENYKDPSFKKLLEKLQEDSWQLELLISGFAIFGLFYAVGPVEKSWLEAVRGDETIFSISLYMILTFLYIMIFNLIVHIILRGLWIGALGLRYVSGEIDYDELNYNKKFTKYLKRKVGSFDDYIGKLENYCSVIFAISFLLVFYVISLALVSTFIFFIGEYILKNEHIPNWVGKTLMISTLIGAILTFIDLGTAGYFKKKHWFSKVYFPVYWVFSRITMSFMYRPLTYNFLDNKLGKRISIFLLPFYFFILITSSFYYQKSNFFRGYNSSSEVISNHNNYDDLNNDDFQFMDFSIPSKVITSPYLRVYSPYKKSIEDLIFEFDPNIKPIKDKRGLSSGIISGFQLGLDISKNKRDALLKAKKDSIDNKYVNTFNQIYSINVDTITYKSDFIIDKFKGNKFGFENYISIRNLSEGKHMLIIRQQIKKDSIGTKIVTKIPFWYYKN